MLCTCCPTPLHMLNMKKMIRAEIKKIKNLKFICPGPRQPDKWTKGQSEQNLGKYFL